VADLLSSGPEPGAPGRSHPRGPRRWAGLLAAGLVATALAVQAGGDARSPRVAPPSFPTRPGPAPAPAVYRLDGDPGTGPAGLRMLIGGRQPGVLDTGTGAVAALPVAVAPREVAELDHAGGTTTVLVHNASRLRSRALAFWPGGGAVPLGPAVDLLPMRDGGVLAEDCSGPGYVGPCTLTAYGRTGAPGWRRSVAQKLDLVRDTPYGLLVGAEEADDAGRLVRLEDARSGAVHRVIGPAYAVLGADDRRVVFTAAACGPGCALTLADLAGGPSRVLPGDPGIPAAAAFSPDGGRLAVGYAGLPVENRSGATQRDGRVAVIDLTGPGRWQWVPGLTTGTDSTALPVWAPDGRLLLVVPTTGAGSGRVVLWAPGAARLTILPVRLTGFYGKPGSVAGLT
jgi:hypothetical protein